MALLTLMLHYFIFYLRSRLNCQQDGNIPIDFYRPRFNSSQQENSMVVDFLTDLLVAPQRKHNTHLCTLAIMLRSAWDSNMRTKNFSFCASRLTLLKLLIQKAQFYYPYIYLGYFVCLSVCLSVIAEHSPILTGAHARPKPTLFTVPPAALLQWYKQWYTLADFLPNWKSCHRLGGRAATR